MEKMPDRLLKPKEAAAELGVSVWTIYRLIMKGDLAAVRVGRLLRIPESSIDAYLDLRRVRPRGLMRRGQPITPDKIRIQASPR